MGWEERMRDAVRNTSAFQTDRTVTDSDKITIDDVDEAMLALDAARAEIERLRTAAADERADVDRLRSAVMRVLAADDAGRGMTRALGELHAAWTAVEGAHVGAAKGAT